MRRMHASRRRRSRTRVISPVAARKVTAPRRVDDWAAEDSLDTDPEFAPAPAAQRYAFELVKSRSAAAVPALTPLARRPTLSPNLARRRSMQQKPLRTGAALR
jgi:hypothetical protein